MPLSHRWINAYLVREPPSLLEQLLHPQEAACGLPKLGSRIREWCQGVANTVTVAWHTGSRWINPRMCCRHISTFPTRETSRSLRKAATISLPPSTFHTSASNGRNPLHPQSYLQGSIDNVAASFPSSPHKTVKWRLKGYSKYLPQLVSTNPWSIINFPGAPILPCLIRISVRHMVQHVGKFWMHGLMEFQFEKPHLFHPQLPRGKVASKDPWQHQ